MKKQLRSNQYTIVCLKWGNKYQPHYVNTLYNMCKRHSKAPFNFVCFTENTTGISTDIITYPLPANSLHGWWLKPYVFSAEHQFKGQVLFLDLDLIVFDRIDKLWSHSTSDFMIIRDFTRHMNPSWQKFNSSVFKFVPENYTWIWEDFYKNHKLITSKMHGDQDYLFSILKTKAKTWPDNWIQSYKWEMRNKSDIRLIQGRRNFLNIAEPKVISDCCIAVFHGEPNPHEVKDPWVIKNWQ